MCGPGNAAKKDFCQSLLGEKVHSYEARTHRQRIIDGAMSRSIPVVGANTVYSESGALLSYSPHGPSIIRATARYVDKLLRGARPADLPVEQPSRFEVIVNQKAARSIGLTVPSTLLLRADRVIQ